MSSAPGDRPGPSEVSPRWASLVRLGAGPIDDALLGQLDFLCMPSRDVERDLASYTGVMGAQLVIAIEAVGPRVAQVWLTGGRPRVLLAGHLQEDAPVLVYRVSDLDTAMADPERRGLRTRCASASRTRDPRPNALGGQRLAVNELTRPGADARLAGAPTPRPRAG